MSGGLRYLYAFRKFGRHADVAAMHYRVLNNF
jgi:hypothetical protein